MPRRWTCERLGITISTFIEHRRKGLYGYLPARRGGCYPRPRQHEVDDEEKGTVFGVKREIWHARRDAIAAGWTETEREHRRFWVPVPGKGNLKNTAEDMPQYGSGWTAPETSVLAGHEKHLSESV